MKLFYLFVLVTQVVNAQRTITAPLHPFDALHVVIRNPSSIKQTVRVNLKTFGEFELREYVHTSKYFTFTDPLSGQYSAGFRNAKTNDSNKELQSGETLIFDVLGGITSIAPTPHSGGFIEFEVAENDGEIDARVVLQVLGYSFGIPRKIFDLQVPINGGRPF